MNTSNTDHFEGKNPYEHVLKKKSEVASEVHGEELPGHYGAFLDAVRDTSILLMVFWTISYVLGLPFKTTTFILILFTILWATWKTIRSAWFSWSLLERLHRVLTEEQYEIENHREQEREELTALYASKGLKGDLLEEVINVLMADDERLLKVMMEEEMGLNLEHYEHPIKIGLGAALGALVAGLLLVLIQYAFPLFGLVILGFLLKSLAGALIAKFQKNDILSALIWNMGAAVLILGMAYFLTRWIQPLFLAHV